MVGQIFGYCLRSHQMFLKLLTYWVWNTHAHTHTHTHTNVTQSCSTLCDPMDCSPPGSSLHGILQARILEWVAIPFSRGSSRLRDGTQVSCPAVRFFAVWATREALRMEAGTEVSGCTLRTPEVSPGCEQAAFFLWLSLLSGLLVFPTPHSTRMMLTVSLPSRKWVNTLNVMWVSVVLMLIIW